jgi:hypothetical protein
MEQVKRGTR